MVIYMGLIGGLVTFFFCQLGSRRKGRYRTIVKDTDSDEKKEGEKDLT